MFSDPVVGNKFFGREEILDLLSKRIDGLKDGYRQNIAIVGPKLLGKSSLILHFLSNFSHPKIIPIYVELRANSLNHFIYKFLGALLYQFLKNRNISVQEELNTLKKYAAGHIPKTTELIQKIENNIKNLQFNQAYEHLLNLTLLLKQESGISCMLILDEFHLLDSYKIKNPFASLAKEIMMQKDTMYIFISSQVSFAKKLLATELSLLFGNFELIRMEPFDYITCDKFLEKRFAGIHLPHNFRDFLISFSQGHPFYLDIISNKLIEKVRELNKREVVPGLIGQAFNSLIYDSQGILNQYFTNLLSHNLNGADYSNFLPILFSAGEKGCQLKDISKTINRHPKIVTRHTRSLLDKDLLDKVGVFYRIQDKIFRFWLNAVYRRKSQSLSADPCAEAEDFSKEIEERICSFTQENKKKISQRIIDLFQSFRNEIVLIQNKSCKLWHFKEVRPWPCAGLSDCIIAHYKGGYWACLIKQDEINEAQIQEFFQFCKESAYPVRKAIIIALKDLDLNSKLLALEKRVWIWSVADLNLILDLYGKEQIVK